MPIYGDTVTDDNSDVTRCPICGEPGEVMIYLPEPTREQWLTLRGRKRRAAVEPCGHDVPLPRRWLNRTPSQPSAT